MPTWETIAALEESIAAIEEAIRALEAGPGVLPGPALVVRTRHGDVTILGGTALTIDRTRPTGGAGGGKCVDGALVRPAPEVCPTCAGTGRV